MQPTPPGVAANVMAWLHDGVTGTHLLHWLSGAVPLATLLIVAGALDTRKAARLLLVGVAMTLLTVLVQSTAASPMQVRYGAPLPMARASVDIMTGEFRSSIMVLRACFVANLLFWCSTSVLLGAMIQALVRRIPGRARSR